MGRFLLIDVAVAGAIVLVWYVLLTRYNRRRGAAVLAWVQAACVGRGQILNPRWKASSSLLKATLSLPSRWFENARLTIRLLPRPLPLQWVTSHYRHEKETLTFEADLGFPPEFRLDVIRHRWSGRSNGTASKAARTWSISRPGPVVLTTKDNWPAEMTPLMNALIAWRDKDFMSVRFRPASPHFTATVAIEHLSNEQSATALMDLFRELAASSSAKQH